MLNALGEERRASSVAVVVAQLERDLPRALVADPEETATVARSRAE